MTRRLRASDLKSQLRISIAEDQVAKSLAEVDRAFAAAPDDRTVIPEIDWSAQPAAAATLIEALTIPEGE